jgi:hypothetical protein
MTAERAGQRIDRLVAAGRVRREPGKCRTLTVVETAVERVDVELDALDGCAVQLFAEVSR